jgi:hypothetical protein
MLLPPGDILIRPETLVGVQGAVEAALGAERCRFESVRT